jgi:PhnB protein
MAERNQVDRLNDAIDALLAGRAAPVADPDLAMLLATAADLRGLPDPGFRKRLKEELVPTAAAVTVQTVRPYQVVRGAATLIEFLERTFDANVELRVDAPAGGIMHAEVRVGDSIVEMGDADEATAAPMHVYVDDVDGTYHRALGAGAESLFEPVDQAYGDREAGIRDPLGNEWFIAHRLQGGRPAGFGTVTPAIRVSGADRFISFLSQAFDAVELERTAPSGVIAHAEVRVGDSVLELSEAHGRWGVAPGTFHVFVDDCDAMYARALAAGGTSLREPTDMPYGERSAGIRDPFGNRWWIGTPLRRKTT